MQRLLKPIPRYNAGFGLVEIMVGLVIGMLATIVMLQVFALSEERKRTTTSGGDASITGVMTFYQLQRDIAQAGYGFSVANMFGCNLTWALPSGSNIATPVALAPVTINPPTAIVPAGDDYTDTLLIIYGNGNGQPQGNTVQSQDGTTYTVQSPASFSVGDKIIATTGSCATALGIDSITAVTTLNVTASSSTAGTTLYTLGQKPKILAYAIRDGNLTMCDYLVNDCGDGSKKGNSAVWIPIASNIVSLRALYARDTSATMDGIPDADGIDQATPTTGCGWARTSAIQLALVARSPQFEKDIVTKTAANAPEPANAPAWSGEATAPLVGSAGALGPDSVADEPWKHYRYKVFQGVLPIRNVAWMGAGAITGC